MTRRQLTLSAFAVLQSMSREVLCASKPPERPSILAVVLSDVTSSLNIEESKEVARLTSLTLDALPLGAEYRVFPIHMDMDRPAPIVQGEVPRLAGFWNDPSLVTQRRNFIAEQVAEHYRKVNQRTRENDQRTCILDSLQFVEGLFGLPQYASVPKQLTIVSDMIEECSMTPLGVGINLNKPAIDEEVRRATSLPTSADWSRVKVAIVLPSNSEPSGRARRRPRAAALRAFWTRVFRQYRVDEHQISWAIGMVPRLSVAQSYSR